MNRKIVYIARQSLLGLIALQLLNIGIGSQPGWYGDYDYSYTWNNTYDPTESAVEWIVELEKGQQSDFSYNNHTDTNKNVIKAFHWQTDLQETRLKLPQRSQLRLLYPELTQILIPCAAADILCPPPEPALA